MICFAVIPFALVMARSILVLLSMDWVRYRAVLVPSELMLASPFVHVGRDSAWNLLDRMYCCVESDYDNVPEYVCFRYR